MMSDEQIEQRRASIASVLGTTLATWYVEACQVTDGEDLLQQAARTRTAILLAAGHLAEMTNRTKTLLQAVSRLDDGGGQRVMDAAEAVESSLWWDHRDRPQRQPVANLLADALDERDACHALFDEVLRLCGHDPAGGSPGLVDAVRQVVEERDRLARRVDRLSPCLERMRGTPEGYAFRTLGIPDGGITVELHGPDGTGASPSLLCDGSRLAALALKLWADQVEAEGVRDLQAEEVERLTAEVARLQAILDRPRVMLFADGREPTTNERHLANLTEWAYHERRKAQEEASHIQTVCEAAVLNNPEVVRLRKLLRLLYKRYDDGDQAIATDSCGVVVEPVQYTGRVVSLTVNEEREIEAALRDTEAKPDTEGRSR